LRKQARAGLIRLCPRLRRTLRSDLIRRPFGEPPCDGIAQRESERLGGGGVPFVIQLRIAKRRTLVSSVSETGLALNAAGCPAFQLFPGQLAPVGEVFSLKPPPPPPCVVLGT